MRTCFNLLVIFLLLHTSCGSQPETSTSTIESETTAEIIADDKTPTEAEINQTNEPTAEPTAIPQEMARTTDPASPIDFWVDLDEVLAPLCQHKYGCLMQGIYPLGWSEDGKFAYLIDHPSEAVENYRLELFIQDMETDKIVAQRKWEASKQPGYTEEVEHNFASVWETEKDNFRKLLAEHEVQEGNGNHFHRLPYMLDGQEYTFAGKNTTAISDYTGSEIISEHQLKAVSGQGEKRVLRQQYGKYDFVLATRAIGLFKSPFEERVAVIDAAEYRGYEGPPNVLKLKLVGCRLTDGFE